MHTELASIVLLGLMLVAIGVIAGAVWGIGVGAFLGITIGLAITGFALSYATRV